MNRFSAIVVIIIVGAQGAAAGEQPVVSAATPYVSAGVVVCDVRCQGLFSEQIVGTVQSGLPAVVELLYTVETRDGEVAMSGIHVFELCYDVWEDVYSIGAGDSTVVFAGFVEMRAAVEQLRGVVIGREDRLEEAMEYSAVITVAVHPLTGSEKRRLEGFVEESVAARSHGSWREQVLNINDLIRRFFSRDKGTSNRSDVFRTDYFAPGELPGSRRPVDGGGGTLPGGMTVACEVR